jgi:hypothetical protein
MTSNSREQLSGKYLREMRLLIRCTEVLSNYWVAYPLIVNLDGRISCGGECPLQADDDDFLEGFERPLSRVFIAGLPSPASSRGGFTSVARLACGVFAESANYSKPGVVLRSSPTWLSSNNDW